MQKKIVVLGTGGTIAGTAPNASDNVGYRAAQLPIGSLLNAVPALDASLGTLVLESEQIMQLDSKDVGPEHWRALAMQAQAQLARADVVGLVITHGTDTLEETAFFLAQVLPAQLLNHKPVVMTGAIRPATSLAPDGPQNLRDSIAVCRDKAARGVLVAFAGMVHAAQYVQKIHPYRLAAFDSGEAGPLGLIEEGVVRWLHPCRALDVVGMPFQLEWLQSLVWPRVDIVLSHACANGAMVRALTKTPQLGDDAVGGIVVAGSGNGTIHKDLEDALLAAQAQGIRVIRSSRCTAGAIVQGPEQSDVIARAAAPTPVKARIALMLDLMRQ
jgi:L-asparaginase